MGLGKTIQCLALLQHRYEQGGLRSPALLICPTSVIANWEKEATRFTPELPLMVHHGPARKKGNAFKKAAEKQALVITSYALLSRDGGICFGRCSGTVLSLTKHKYQESADPAGSGCPVTASSLPHRLNRGHRWRTM